MFIKTMTVYGYMTAWVVFFIITTMVMRDFVKKEESGGKGIDLGMYIRNLVESFIMNFLIVVITLYTFIAILIGRVHWFWLIAGIATTFILYISNMVYIRVGERISEKKLDIDVSKYKKEEVSKKVKKNKLLYYIAFVLNLVMYTVIILNAWDVIPIRQLLLPPLMPILYHLVTDWVIIGVILTMNFLMLVILKDWLKYVKIEKELR